MDPLPLLALLAVVAAAPGDADPDPDRIYGRVTTAGGRVLEGYIRWDHNEGSWCDLLHGSKELPLEYLRDAEGAGLADRADDDRIEILGLRISWADDDGFPERAASGVRFGHLRSLRVLDDDAALLILKSGQEIELGGGSSDVGSGNRGITVTDPHGEAVELRWRDLERIDFRAPPGGDLPPGVGRRLHGVLETRDAGRYTGYVAWDADEILTTDVLDGDEDGRDREIPFGEIAAIERDGPSGARVVLRSGEEVRLTGSNDVDRGNRGISVSDPTLGQVTVEWDGFESLVFTEPESSDGYDAFDGGAPLHGTVIDDEGNAWSGRVRWDNDESRSWELLNGDYGGAEFEVELSTVSWIRRRSSRVAEVLLRDGRVLELEGSNDVDRRNKGIFVTTESGDVVAVPWEEFRELRLSRD